MIRIGKLSRVLLTVAFVIGSTRAHAYTVTVGSPAADSTWQAGNNSNMACSGKIEWDINPPQPEMRPTTGIVYLHAGGNAGVTTNSVQMTIANIQASSEDWSANLTLIPASPPLYGGNGKSGVYTVEADAQVAGQWVSVKYVQVTMVNG